MEHVASCKRRRWFQLHLSTLIVVTLVAGVLMLANRTAHSYQPSGNSANIDGSSPGIIGYGWPRKSVFLPKAGYEDEFRRSSPTLTYEQVPIEFKLG